MSLSEQLQEQKETLLAALEQEERQRLDELLPELRAADLSEILEELVEEEDDLPTVLKLLDYLSLERRANVIGYLPGEIQLLVAQSMADELLLSVLEEMGSDERADLFNLLDEDRQEALLRRMARQEREDLKRLASYEEGTAGAIMTSTTSPFPAA